jgi:NDP-sugar pyrophosphorylase family protein
MVMPPVAVLAGGLATRMRPFTETVPKSMLMAADEPFVAHQLRLFRREGIGRVVLCVGYLWEMIADFVGDGSRFGLRVDYSVEKDQLLGTGGALKKALPLLSDEFLVHYGDSYLDIPFGPVVDTFRRSARMGLMTVYRNNDMFDISNVAFDGCNIIRYSKRNRTSGMHYIDWGLGALRHEALASWPDNEPFDLANVYEKLAETGQLAAYEVHSRFYEIGSPSGLVQTNEMLRARAGK